MASIDFRHDTGPRLTSPRTDQTIQRVCKISAALLFLFLAAASAVCAPAHGSHGVAATGHPLAAEAAVEAMRHGGNAVDAAVAAALTLGVVDSANSGIGGGCFLLIHTAAGEDIAVDGRETAPRAAFRDMFLRDGKADPHLSQTGALASGTPGALAAYDLALRRFGKLPLKVHLLCRGRACRARLPYQRRIRDSPER